MKISNKEIVEWLTLDGYSWEDASNDILEANITTQVCTIVEYENGKKDVIYKDQNGKIQHLNAFGQK